MPKSSDTEIISFSAPKKLAKDIEALTDEIGYTNRSELIRDAVRLLMKSKVDIDGIEGNAEGVIITLYDHSAEMDASDIRHRNMDIIRSFMHTDFSDGQTGDRKTCCDVLIYSGDAARIKKLAFNLGAIKNVKEVKLFVA